MAASSGWLPLSDASWTRECIGGEQSASYNQNVGDGHTELTIEVPFSSSFSTSELIQRVRNAWLVCHSTHPHIAGQLSTGTEIPQMMKYEALRSEQDAHAWLRETLHVVTGQTAHDVARSTYSRRLQTKGKRSMLYLVTAPWADPEDANRHCLVWNLSHVLADASSIPQLFNQLLSHVMRVPGDVDATVGEINYSRVLERLPISPVTAYEAQYRPTPEEKERAIQEAVAQAELYAAKLPQSVAMYPEANTTSRPHETHCIRLQYSLDESRALLSELRRESLSITYAASAATLLAVKQIYEKGHESGGLIGMTRSAQRWVDTSRSIPSAADVVFLWIPFEQHWFGGSTRHTILSLGRAIRARLAPHLTSPHYLSAASFTSRRAVAALAAAAAQADAQAAPCPPGFSPQGALGLRQEYRSSDGDAWIRAHDFVHTGRQVNDSPWVGMFSLWDRVTLSMGFDSKYHDARGMEAFMAAVKSNLGSIVEQPTANL
ncbi:Alcohol acetyltransferase [Metarhizium album ARSEF 1941]|uniref:Alcohol acetyltransferase n=1 Tax=Metarhizium album (strain ARSEF 1941) TaxID=1081103 RepID=A0A0B2WIT9_METAS|nr:Alcohol acetyltransferase [Metarhizium album ARSEF 1941]KHN93738.1 Alcohol acetyltransferase [Metarhizium album ARSEF 1941]